MDATQSRDHRSNQLAARAVTMDVHMTVDVAFDIITTI